jgi:hypothetical protein
VEESANGVIAILIPAMMLAVCSHCNPVQKQ